MKLTIISSEQIEERTVLRWGALQNDESLLDLIRAEVTARRSGHRWVALRRVAEALGDTTDIQTRLRELCDRLEYEGDITASSGGILHVSPVRAIRLTRDSHRIISSLPSHRLRALLPGVLVVEGLHRIHRFAPNTVTEAESVVQSMGGVVLSPEAWAGLNLAPMADLAWLNSLNQRLQWESAPASSLERDGALDWQCLVLTDDGPRWRRTSDEPARLWRARTSYGRWIWAWTDSLQSPSHGPFVQLFDDETSRTLFAVARTNNRPVAATVVRDDTYAYFQLRERLPRAEYRYLSSFAKPGRIENYQHWSIPLSRADEVLDTLCQRLGLELNEEALA